MMQFASIVYPTSGSVSPGRYSRWDSYCLVRRNKPEALREDVLRPIKPLHVMINETVYQYGEETVIAALRRSVMADSPTLSDLMRGAA